MYSRYDMVRGVYLSMCAGVNDVAAAPACHTWSGLLAASTK